MKTAIRCLGLFFLLIGVPFAVFSMGDKETLIPAGPGAQLNQPAPDFSLKNLAGNSVSLQDYRGRVVLVNFWASWCPPCDMEIPSLSALAENYREKGVVVLAINVERIAKERLAAFLSSRPHQFSTLLDPSRETQFAYGVRKLPETFLVDQNGVVIKRYIGARDWMALDITRTLDFLLGG